MKKLSIFFLFLINFAFGQKLLTPYEKGNKNQSTSYQQMVDFYDELDKKHETIKVFKTEEDDNGEYIRTIVFNPDKDFDFEKKQEKAVLFINNGIHPGEPDGIDATMMMIRDFAEGKLKAPKNVIIAAIGCYNISGMMNRGRFSRANQNGPEEYGFRGNARNFDLNRDFIKTDSKNAWAFQKIFHQLNPDYFIDNHVSNGADYQYTFTYISTNKERMGKTLGNFLHQEMQPEILKNLDQKNILHVPYVNIYGDSPDKGFPAFMDSPRYATGFTSLFNVPGTVAETHMLKPYKQRVEATLDYMLSTIDYLEKNSAKIKNLKKESLSELKAGNQYPISWKLDSTKTSLIKFKGYESGKKTSDVSGKPRLFYDRNKPFERNVKFYDTYIPTKNVKIPRYYVVPQSEWKVMQYLKHQNIEFKKIEKDSVIAVESYKIADFKTAKNPYEGHYPHYETFIQTAQKNIKFRKGDYLISTNQLGVKYLLETLEPEATDSFFNWNFFDGILGQKEYFSDYVFEDTAADLLKKDQVLRTAFEMEKIANPEFAKDGNAQLDWVYRNSQYFEKTLLQYPIYRIP